MSKKRVNTAAIDLSKSKFEALQHFSIKGEAKVYRVKDPVNGLSAEKLKELLDKRLIKEVSK